VFNKYDALLTIGGGPASRSSHSAKASWESQDHHRLQRSAARCPSATALVGPAAGVQIASRPFEDATALAIAHAYEKATG
jgi:Asp-tRNA(Asn)/Glu-tRNA(Gln) amidotransferase A subunit family amidase